VAKAWARGLHSLRGFENADPCSVVTMNDGEV
jgi:hypothetical protein